MDFLQWLQQLLAWFSGQGTPSQPENNDPVQRKVMTITYAPPIPSLGNRPLCEAITGWNQPDPLLQQYCQDLSECSYGYANYTIVDSITVPEFVPMWGGGCYTPDLFLAALADHQPKIEDRADYAAILSQHQILQRVRAGEIDEVWLMGYPFAGLRESRMAGPGAFFCNGEVLENTSAAGRRFVVMGFSYERGAGEMLESFSHRAESILDQVFSGKTGADNLWERFTRIDWDHPGQAEVGTVHHGPNAFLSPDREDHQWNETRSVLSRHRTWYQFPDLHGQPEPTSCDAWHAPDMTWGHHTWWLKHLPHVPGQTAGVSNNWWKYIIDPEQV
jgi:hypothetical protein